MPEPRAFRILNVFTIEGNPLSGNPLCVFERGEGLSTEQMLALARQFNLSETTFVLQASSPAATAQVRIFTPSFEMPFAGHPTLGTTHVVRSMAARQAVAPDKVTLEMKVGLVEVTRQGTRYTLRAAKTPETREPAPREALATMVGLEVGALADHPKWVDTGAEQLVIPLRSVEDVMRATPKAEALARDGFSAKRGASMAYVWARKSDSEIVARFFFLANGAVVEDPATGSACANLGGWFLATGAKVPLSVKVRQGDVVGRPSELGLAIDDAKAIFVSGEVLEVGRGTFDV